MAVPAGIAVDADGIDEEVADIFANASAGIGHAEL
jgi:hypothetical protein